MSKTAGRNIQHLSEEELLLLADGELTGRDLEKARVHLDGCWTCRGRFDALQSAISAITQLRNEQLANSVETPPSPWHGLEARFDAADRQHDRLSPPAVLRQITGLSRVSPALRRGALSVAAVGLLAVWLSTSTATAAMVRGAFVQLVDFVVTLVRPQSSATQPQRDVVLRPDPPATPIAPSTSTSTAVRTAVKSAPTRVTPRELLDLDVEAIARLDRAGALLGEQVAVERLTDRGELRIHGVVDTTARKRELLNALGPLVSEPSVIVDVKTMDEALATQTAVPNTPLRVQSVEIDAKPTPISEDIRRFVVSKLRSDGGRGQPDDEAVIRREMEALTTSVLTRAFQARLHARALSQTVDRYSRQEMSALTVNARKTWHRIVRQHAEAFARETAALRTTLQPLFFANETTDPVESDVTLSADADLSRAGGRLFELGSYHDAIIARAFSLSVGEPQPPSWRQLHQSLKTAEQLAERIAKFTTQ